MILFRSALFNLLAFLWSLLVMIVMLPTLAVGGAPVLWVSRLWGRGSLALLRLVCGLDYELQGRENLPKPPYLVASKHQSAWETLAFHLLFPDTIYVLKQELLRVPLFGWYLARAGNVAVDRSGGANALRVMVAQACDRVAEGRTIVIFPEGTRSAPGERRRYHPGVVALYNALNLPIVPVALNSGVYWPRNAFAKRPGRIVVRFLPAIPVGLERRDFLARLQSAIETASEDLAAEAAADLAGGPAAPRGEH